MDTSRYVSSLAAVAALAASSFVGAQPPPATQPAAPQQPMSFFVTSAGPGDGANLGGLTGADAYCQRLAAAVGAGDRTWHAYLSASASGNQPAVHARDRIGAGPWYNARGARIAQSVADLHGDTLDAARLGNNLSRTTALSEKAEPIKGAGDTPNQHDILTGSQTDGRGYTDAADHTCGNWTSNNTGAAQVGHFDRTGGGNTSWNSAHASRGCSQPNLVSTGGAGFLYCFAVSPAPGGGRGGAGAALFGAADSNKDGALTRDELKGTFDKWISEWDTRRSGTLTDDQIAAGLNLKPTDVQAMMAALPDAAPVKPKQPRKVLVLGRAAGFVHSSIPLAAKTIEALGTKTGAWSTVITYDPADITAQNLKQYDAIVLASTTGEFLDDPKDQAATTARKKALLDFIRGGKGIVGIHAATDSYHGDPASPAIAGVRSGPNANLAWQLVSQGDKNNDRKVTKAELAALADAWFDKLDPTKTGRVSEPEFAQRFGALMTPPPPPSGRGSAPVNVGTWPEWDKIIGGYFKFHWNDPQLIVVKIDDPKSPITAPFKGQSFEIRDETYTYVQDSFSRDNVHVLTSVDYSKMSDEDKAKEPAATRRTDGDYALSWIRREGKGRLFAEAHGHSERVYAMKPMLEHLLAGVQYAIGDLKADDTPGVKAGTK